MYLSPQKIKQCPMQYNKGTTLRDGRRKYPKDGVLQTYAMWWALIYWTMVVSWAGGSGGKTSQRRR